MRPVIQHVPKLAKVDIAIVGRWQQQMAQCRRGAFQQTSTSFICAQCQYRQMSIFSRQARSVQSKITRLGHSRFSTWVSLREERKTGNPISSSHAVDGKATFSAGASQNTTTVAAAPEEDLPSHREMRRWSLSKRVNKFMDNLMPRFALASQKINNYTGTDYTGIEALRREIKEQEQLVKARGLDVETAKSSLAAAHTKRASSQKEVVGLLERKNSWSADDLDQYMSLIRSEHLNDKDVEAANDQVAVAERALDESRTKLERRERAQYHEEQIWSDTIRRNSTWVTIGLMGVNVVLLLANFVVFEPWRRRRLVKEITRVMDENTAAAITHKGMPLSLSSMEREIDSVVEPAGVPLETFYHAASSQPDQLKQPDLNDSNAVAASLEGDVPRLEAWNLANGKAYLQQLFSDQRISIRKVDLTTIALEGAAVGVAVAGGILLILRVY